MLLVQAASELSNKWEFNGIARAAEILKKILQLNGHHNWWETKEKNFFSMKSINNNRARRRWRRSERNFVIAGTSREHVNSNRATMNLKTIIVIVFRGLNMIFKNCNNETGFHAAPKSSIKNISLKRPGQASERWKEIEFLVLSYLTAFHE